ncbi:hypothetical protein Tco_1283932 [Tanacetum coccineum]
MPNQRTSIPFPSRRNDERRREKANDQIEKFYEIFRDLSFEISFTDALTLMPKFASTLKTLLENKEKLSEMARTPKQTSRALIDVYEGEITLRVGKEAITFNLDQTSRYTANYNHMTANRIDVIELACEEYSQEVLDSDFLLLEEANAFIAVNDEPISREIDATYYDPGGIREELKVVEAKSSFDEPPEVELKDLPPHLEYAFLEDDNKLPVIIAKDLKVKEKARSYYVLKVPQASHRLEGYYDIKGV